MGKSTGIEWTDHTFNPWWGCEKVSEACRSCYAEEFANRFPKTRGLWGKTAPRKVASEKTWAEPLAWFEAALSAGVQRRVFCASMADVFEERPDLVAPRARLMELAAKTVAHGTDPGLVWMFLTKRPENVLDMLVGTALEDLARRKFYDPDPRQFWFGTTAESQGELEKRTSALGVIPSRVHFVSCEPLLGPLDFCRGCPECGTEGCGFSLVDWVIVGGESGENARPLYPDWVRSIRNQCQDTKTPFFFKQWGEWMPRERGVGVFDTLAEHNRDRIVDARGLVHCTREASGPIAVPMSKVGKKAAGALLDGREHREFPA